MPTEALPQRKHRESKKSDLLNSPWKNDSPSTASKSGSATQATSVASTTTATAHATQSPPTAAKTSAKSAKGETAVHDDSDRQAKGKVGSGKEASKKPEHSRGKKKDSGSSGERMKKISISLAYVLRHHAEELGIHLDKAGYASVHDVLKLSMFHNVSKEEIDQIVAEDTKQRYSFAYDAFGTKMIRANQGHSISSVDETLLLEPVHDPSLFHVVVWNIMIILERF